MNPDELDLKAEYSSHFQHQCNLMSKAFQGRRINFHPFENKEEVAPFICDFIKNHEAQKVGFSDGVTLHQCSVFDAVNKMKGIEVINPFERTSDGKYKVFEDQPIGEKLNLPRDEYYRRMAIVVDRMR